MALLAYFHRLQIVTQWPEFTMPNSSLWCCNHCKGGSLTAVSLVQLTNKAQTRIASGEPTELVVDGKTLNHILGDKAAEAQLARLGSLCTAVVVCRASPSQKANIVTMMREHELHLVQRDARSAFGRWLAKQNRNLGVC
jgi:magnesium-transporting ATPase (P-type)